MTARILTATLAAAALLAGPLAAPAAAQDSAAQTTARRTLDATAHGKTATGFLHFGTTYVGHRFVRSGQVTGKANHFYLEYQYDWRVGNAALDQTTLLYFFDDRGRLYGTRAGRTTAVLSQPFVVAQLSIRALGEVAYDAVQNDLTDSGRRLLRDLVDRADAQGLFELVTTVKLVNRR